jgi:molybdate transport system substrate-binding protein
MPNLGTTRTLFAVTTAILTLTGSTVAAGAAEIKVPGTLALKAALIEDFLPQCERTTGHRVEIKYDQSPVLKRQIDGGEAFDLAIVTPAVIDELIKEGKIEVGSRAVVEFRQQIANDVEKWAKVIRAAGIKVE